AGEPARFFEDGFTRKLNFKSHPLIEALRRLLADFDRHCVADVRSLRNTPHAMTVEGLMSGRRKFFNKNDQISLDRGWMTGFDNRDQVAELETSLKRLQLDLQRAKAEETEAQT